MTIVLHDVAPATREACQRVLDCVRSVGSLAVTLLAVPHYHDRPSDGPFERWLDRALKRGDELALHGWTHLDPGEPRGAIDALWRRVYTTGEGEFAALSVDEAEMRIRRGLRWFSRRGWPVSGFVPPAWLMSEGTLQALRRLPIAYTCTHGAVMPLPQGLPLPSRAVTYSTRSAWRRAASRVYAPMAARLQAARPLLRLELHPHDADHPAVRQQWMGLLAEAIESGRAGEGRVPVTLAGAVHAWQAEQLQVESRA